MADLAPGVVIDGAYALERAAAEEVLGPVWFARDTRRGRAVRLKILRRDHLLDDQRFRRFQRELEAFGRVRTPGLLELLDTGVHDGLAYAVFAAVPERTLADRIAEGPVPWRQAVDLVTDLTIALGALHREGIVHRDLVAQNVLLDGRDRPWIRDLGLAWLVSTEDDTGSLTDGEGRVGHLAAMAPEYLSQQELTPAADLYALGVLSYQLLTGVPPYEGQGNALVKAALSGAPPLSPSMKAEVPRWLDHLVLALLDRDPGQRPSPDAVLARIRKGLADEAAPPPRRWGRWVAGAAAGVVGVIAVGAVAAAWWARPAPQGLEPSASGLAGPAEEVDPPVALWVAPAAGAATPARVIRDEGEARAAAPQVVTDGAEVVIRANRKALVTLDGLPVGLTPLRIHAEPGPHQLRVALPGRADTRQESEVVLHTAERRALSFVF